MDEFTGAAKAVGITRFDVGDGLDLESMDQLVLLEINDADGFTRLYSMSPSRALALGVRLIQITGRLPG